MQPIRRDLADLLGPWLEERAGDERVFCRMSRCMARTLRTDLDAARAAWVAESKSAEERQYRTKSQALRYEDEDGRFADFHALRHTYVSQIVAGGANMSAAQELSRHSDPRLTLGRYSHARLHDITGALDALPDTRPTAGPPERQVLQATGTEDSSPESRAASGAAVSTRNSSNPCFWVRPRNAAGEPSRGGERSP